MSTVAPATTDTFEIAGRAFASRLIIGTGKYRSFDEMKAAHRASGAEMVTVAVRRVPLDRSSESFLDHLDPALAILPNTAGCYTAEEAIRTARLAREALGTDLIKLEVLGVQNPANLRIMREQLPDATIIVDAGVGTASDAAIAMELGADAVLMNTAIAEAENPEQMATAMKLAIEAGRLAYLAGRMPKRLYASASSPLTGVVR